ncbi:diguanylate cyclase [Psychrosphaera aquimarina]|uniref:diguanylate cyclase n=1 Tax=Psychrosphaera aquimarina TaxID=2044854 RepID=A0ABU3R076_9GAMM|nr:diguanylate cyclase [Psychrosphaera aquimarina]MDU0113091.1 diguanylate cyclase [Psychrosphaera aquimarina]
MDNSRKTYFMNIKSIMVSAKLNGTPDSSVKQLLDDMIANQHSCGLIGTGNTLQGIINEREVMLVCQAAFQGEPSNAPREVIVSEIMNKQPFCLHQDTPIYDAFVTAKVKQLRSLPVIDDDDRLVGIVTQSELLDAYIKLMELDKDLKITNKKLKSLALEDSLMKIGSRHAMEIDLKYTAAQAKRNKSKYSIAMVDVDFFKRYNDMYGHQSGDVALLSIANIINKVSRESDRVYRYGGEEVLIIMSDTDEHGAKESAERIRAAIEIAAIEHLASELKVLTVSIGLCTKMAGNWEEMVNVADTALYQAKQTGRNRVR